jgi:threonine/homoserine/homoserine lactone efflux protein
MTQRNPQTGVGEFLGSHGGAMTAAVGLAGGAVLIWMGVQGLLDLRKTVNRSGPHAQRHPFWIGVLLTAANPYFHLWWATVGLTFITQGIQLGMLAFGLFLVGHWLCDLVWLEVLSVASFRGSTLLGGRKEKVILAVCALILLAFGCKFLYDAARGLVLYVQEAQSTAGIESPRVASPWV